MGEQWRVLVLLLAIGLSGCVPIPYRPSASVGHNAVTAEEAAAITLSTNHNRALIESASVLYLEGYLWDPKNAKDAFIKAAKIAHEAGRTVALCVTGHVAAYKALEAARLLVKAGARVLPAMTASRVSPPARNPVRTGAPNPR